MFKKKEKSFGKAGSTASKDLFLCPASSHFQKTNLSVCKCDICSQLPLLWKHSLEVVRREAGENKCVMAKHETPHKEWSVLGNPKHAPVFFPYRNMWNMHIEYLL